MLAPLADVRRAEDRDDLEAERERLQRGGVALRSDIVSGPGGRQLLPADPAGNLVELFTPADHR